MQRRSWTQGRALMVILTLLFASCSPPTQQADPVDAELEVSLSHVAPGLKVYYNDVEQTLTDSMTYDHATDSISLTAAAGMDSYEWFAGTTYLAAFAGEAEVDLVNDEQLDTGNRTVITLVVTKGGVAASATVTFIDENT